MPTFDNVGHVTMTVYLSQPQYKFILNCVVKFLPLQLFYTLAVGLFTATKTLVIDTVNMITNPNNAQKKGNYTNCDVTL